MMRNLVVIAVLLLSFCTLGVAQELPQFEILGGWSYVRPDGGAGEMSPTQGWNASLNIVINEWFGVAVDGAGHYASFMDSDNQDGEYERQSSARTHDLVIGPRFTLRQNEKFQPFYHAMAGIRHSSTDDFVSFTPASEETPAEEGWAADTLDNFVMVFGGGLDVAINEKLSIRAFQADYVIERYYGDMIPELRFGAGVVYRIGEK